LLTTWKELFVILLVIISVVGVILIVLANCKHESIEYPPLTDAEFMDCCKTGTDPKVALRVRRIVADNLGASYDRLAPSTSFQEDLGAD
jgi:hypothetical protein